jgi:hypothetical protein
MMRSMGRLHLFELGDQPWLPAAWHRYMTEYLCTVEELAGAKMTPLVALLETLLGHARGTQIVDLCSGPAGPWRPLKKLLREAGHDDVTVVLTDRAPSPDRNDRVREEGVSYHRHPVDATAVPATLSGPRTVFNGFHHFRPEDARRLLADAVARRQPIGVFEMLSRHPAHILTAPLIVVAVMLITPLIRPFRWGRLLWTYLIPIVPLLVMWDGLVSALRVYSPRELEQLVRGLDDYHWEIGQVSTLGPPAPYLLGWPREGPALERPADAGVQQG